MPKAAADPELQRKVRALVERHGGNYRRTAEHFGIQTSTLWRFTRTGRATPRISHVLREGLADGGRARHSPERLNAPGRRSTRNIAFLREVLHSLLEALDAYERPRVAARRTSSGGEGV